MTLFRTVCFDRVTIIMRYFIVSVLVVFPFVMAPGAKNEAFITKQKVFIRELYLEKRYFDCISETGRLIASFGPGSDTCIWRNFMTLNYYLGGQYGSAIYSAAAGDDSCRGFYQANLVSRSYLLAGNGLSALQTMGPFSYDGLTDNEQVFLLARRAECYLHDHDLEAMIREIDLVRKKTDDLLKLKDTAEEFMGSGTYWPSGAAVLSAVLPGLGQLYGGRYIDSALSLLSVVSLAAGTYYTHEKNKRGVS